MKTFKVENEEWKDIPGIKNYQASNLGRIRSLDRLITSKIINGPFLKSGRVLKTSLNNITGYRFVHIKINNKRKHLLVHRLIAITFIPNPENKRCVNHKNSIRDDNRLVNLEWATHSENVKYGFKYGFAISRKGIECNLSKLKENDVVLIRDLHKHGFRQNHISKLMNLSTATVFNIIKRNTWKHV